MSHSILLGAEWYNYEVFRNVPFCSISLMCRRRNKKGQAAVGLSTVLNNSTNVLVRQATFPIARLGSSSFGRSDGERYQCGTQQSQEQKRDERGIVAVT